MSLSIDFSSVRDYCKGGSNTLAASVSFSVGGTYYTSAPTVAFSGGGGTGAAATAHITNGVVTSITMTAGGTGYTSAPTIAFTGGGGTGAAATSTIATGAVTGGVITNSGGKNVTITDTTAYASGEARAIVQLTFFDHFGGKLEASIAGNDVDNAITTNLTGLNPVDGIDSIVTVISTLGNKKDGSVHDMVTIKTTGNYVMEL